MPDLIRVKRSTSAETRHELTSGTTVWNGPLEMATTIRKPGQILVNHPGDCVWRGMLRSSAARWGLGGKNV